MKLAESEMKFKLNFINKNHKEKIVSDDKMNKLIDKSSQFKVIES